MFFIIVCHLTTSFYNVYAEEEEVPETTPMVVDVNAEAVVLMDVTSGSVLFQKNGLLELEIASVTKIMTVYLAIKYGDLDAMVKVYDTAIDTIDRNSSHIALTYDEEVSLKDLCYATLLASANDAANAIAEHISGSQEAFVKKMNETAIAMGAQNTLFINAHGLPSEDIDNKGYSTAYDLALMLREIMKDETFVEIASTRSYTASPTNKQSEARVFANGNDMIKSSEYFYEHALFGKTGWTSRANYTFVGVAEKDGMDLIAVVLNAPSTAGRYTSAKNLFDYGFDNYKQVLLSSERIGTETYQFKKGNKVQADIVFSFPNNLHILVSKDTLESAVDFEIELKDTEDINKISASIIIYVNNVKVGEVDMKKDVTMYEIGFMQTTYPIIKKGFDYFSVAVMMFFMSLVGVSFVLSKTKKKRVH